jgi:hypothetical protein
MQAAPALSQPDRLPEFLNENDHIVTVRKCEIRRQRLHPVGEAMELNIKEAIALLAPSGSRLARTNILRAKTGQFVGVKSDSSNFVIVNPTTDGDIRWLLRKHPDLPMFVRDIYFVESATIRRNAIDLKSDGDAGDTR